MPTLVDLLAHVSFLAAKPAVIGILITAGILVVNRDWRLDAIALTVQYFFVVLLLTRLIRLEVAAVKGLIGWLICMVFYLTERRASMFFEQTSAASKENVSSRWHRWIVSTQVSFHLLAGILIAVAAYTAALRIPLPEIPGDITLACYLLAGLGLLLIGLSEEPIQIGLGLLTFLSGFELFYVALEPSLAVTGLLGAVNFIIALATAYLRTTQIAVAEQGDTP